MLAREITQRNWCCRCRKWIVTNPCTPEISGDVPAKRGGKTRKIIGNRVTTPDLRSSVRIIERAGCSWINKRANKRQLKMVRINPCTLRGSNQCPRGVHRASVHYREAGPTGCLQRNPKVSTGILRYRKDDGGGVLKISVSDPRPPGQW